jgi:hypothetical protein
MLLKTCINCKLELEQNIDNFSLHSSGSFRNQCRKCKKEQNHKYYCDNMDKIKERANLYYQDNVDHCIEQATECSKNNPQRRKEIRRNWAKNNPEQQREWIKNNPEKVKNVKKRWVKNHPEKMKEIRRRGNTHRRLNEANMVFECFTDDDVILKYGNRCFYCLDGSFEHLDHYIPISKGGNHTLSNVRPSCACCNLRKHNKMPEEWILINTITEP